jgi:hypothetical protein
LGVANFNTVTLRNEVRNPHFKTTESRRTRLVRISGPALGSGYWTVLIIRPCRSTAPRRQAPPRLCRGRDHAELALAMIRRLAQGLGLLGGPENRRIAFFAYEWPNPHLGKAEKEVRLKGDSRGYRYFGRTDSTTRRTSSS